MTAAERVRALAVPCFVVALAAFHAHRTIAYEQSSWGAGQPLGMFGRVDSHGSRAVRIEAIAADGATRPMDLPTALDDLALQVRVMPRDARRMRALAEALSSQLAPGERLRISVVRVDGRTLASFP